MMIFKRDWSLPIIITLGLAIPTGVSNNFLFSTVTSSLFDEQRVLIPVISLQSILVAAYILTNLDKFTATYYQVSLLTILSAITLLGSLYSIHPHGYLSYSTTWILTPIAIKIHLEISNKEKEICIVETIARVALIFAPFYLFDLIISTVSFGVNEFSSYTLATNGHTFVSMLFVIFIQLLILLNPSSNYLSDYRFLCLLIYLIGGILSQGRVAIVGMLLSSIAIHWNHAKKALPIGLIVFTALISFNEKIKVLFEAIIDADFSNQVAWSSLISRFNFWDVFFNIFLENPIAGAGGLSANIIKYDFNFPYPVFVDPHNEFIFIVSGFGLFGVLFVFLSIFFMRSLPSVNYKVQNISSQRTLPKLALPAVVSFIFLCSLTNANSAKQNIEVLFCFTLLLLSIRRADHHIS